MRVLHVIDSLAQGGAEQSLAEMLPYLSDAGVRSLVATLHRREGVETLVREAGAPVRVLDGGGRPGRLRSLRQLVLRSRPDLVHTTLFEASVLGRLACWGTGIPVLTSLVNVLYVGEHARDPNIRRSRLLAARMVEAWTSRHLTAHFHAITTVVKRSAVETLGIPPDRITIIERGRDRRRLGEPSAQRRLSARRQLGVAPTDTVLLNMGRHEYQKGQRYLLEAFQILVRNRPNLVLLVAGRTGNATPDLERLIDREGLGGRVRLLGFRRDVPDLLAAADVFVFPSLFEGLGGSVIEAMAMGLPVVASDLPAVREVVDPGRSAVLVPPRDAPRLAGAVAGLLDDPDQAVSFGRAGLRIFDERFQLSASSARMVDLYRWVIAAGRTRERHA